jgi:hypothetical protein
MRNESNNRRPLAIGGRRRVETADLADELQRRVVELLIGRGRGNAGLAQALDIPAHRYAHCTERAPVPRNPRQTCQ